jgi:hypothetical protein
MTASTTINKGEFPSEGNSASKVLHQKVLGSRRFSNYWWATVVSMGSVGFFLAGISSYLKVNLLFVTDPTQLIFYPQGLVMGLYGSAGLLLALYLWLTVLWDIGGGYNDFNRETKKVKIFRWGFPGKNRRIEIDCGTQDVQSVRVEIKEGIETFLYRQ